MDYLDSRHVDYTRGHITIHLTDQITRLENELSDARRMADGFRIQLEQAQWMIGNMNQELDRQRAALAMAERNGETLTAAAQLASMNTGGLAGRTPVHLDRRVGGSSSRTGLDPGSTMPTGMPVPEGGFEGENDVAGGQDNNNDRPPARSHRSAEAPSPRLPGSRRTSRFRGRYLSKKRKADEAEATSRSPYPAPTRQRRLSSHSEQRLVSNESLHGEADDPYASDPTLPIRLDCDTPTPKSDDETYIPSDHSAFEWDSESASHADDSGSVSDFDDGSEPTQASSTTRSSAPSPRPLPSRPPSPTPGSPANPPPPPPPPSRTRRYARSRQTVRRFAVGTVPGIHFEFTRKARKVADIYREWYVGIPCIRGGISNPPIATLEREHGTAWRSNPDEKGLMKYSSNYVSVRRLVVEFVDREVERRRAGCVAAGLGEREGKGKGEGEEEFEAEDVCRELDAVVRGKIQRLTECLRARRDPFEEFGDEW